MTNERKKDNERAKPRFKIQIQDTKHKVIIIDISATGAHIETTNKYHLGDICNLTIDTGTSGKKTSISGKVVWGRLQEKQNLNQIDTYEYGLAFKKTGNMDVNSIIELIMNTLK